MDFYSGSEVSFKLLDLSNKKEPFTSNEIDFVKKYVPKSKYKFIYAIWKQKRNNEKYIVIGIDYIPYQTRKSSIENSIEIICTRELSDIEHHEESINYGCNNRRFLLFSLKCVEMAIKYDDSYGIKTPNKFIDKCKELGYSDPEELYRNRKKHVQMTLNF